MKRYGKNYILTQDLLNEIATYMNDEVRENLHLEIASCTPELFLKEYIKRDAGFKNLLVSEFGIEME